ncbi:MAG TPA: hypothetical protein VGE52_18540 [Pirellulales bacterium]
MSVGDFAGDAVPARLFYSPPGKLTPEELERLWEVFVKIGERWGARSDNALYQRSQWLEFVTLKCEEDPSYLAEYHNAIKVLDSLQTDGRTDWEVVFVSHGIDPETPPTTRLGHFRVFVVVEFIKVWLASGGFRSYGAGNYNGYVSGSRFAVVTAYRRVPPPGQPPEDQAPNPQTGPIPAP